MKYDLNNQRKKINIFITGIEDIIKKLNDLIDNIENYYNIYYKMIENYENKNRNFIILKNLIDMKNYNNHFYNDINKINDEKDIIIKFKSFIKIYNYMGIKNQDMDSIDKIVDDEDNHNQIEENNIDKKKSTKDNIGLDDKNSNNNIAKNENLNTIENNEYKKNVDNYENLDYGNLKLITKIEYKDDCYNLIELKDGRFALIIRKFQKDKYLCVYNLKNNNNCDISFNLNDMNSENIFLLEDGNVIISGNSIKLIKIFEKNIEIIQIIESFDEIINLDNGMLVKYGISSSNTFQFYSYENNKLISQKKSIEIANYDIFFDTFYGINKNEIIFIYNYLGFFSNFNYYLVFYDINKDKIIKYLKIDNNIWVKSYFMNEHRLIINVGSSDDDKILVVDLENRSIQKIKIKCDFSSLVFLSENCFLLQHRNSSLSKYKFNYEGDIDLEFKGLQKYKGDLFGKCRGNKLIFLGNDNISIYG